MTEEDSLDGSAPDSSLLSENNAFTPFWRSASCDSIRGNAWQAVKWSVGWVLASILFNVFVLTTHGSSVAFEWSSGYILQFVMAIDNMLIFFLIYEYYSVPPALRSVALTWGFAGTIFFQLVLLTLGHEILAHVARLHMAVGIVMICMAIVSISCVSDATSKNAHTPTSKLPSFARQWRFLDFYADDGSFFVKLPANLPDPEETYGTRPQSSGTRIYATMLVWVILCQELIDCMFAVDTTMIISSEVPNLFIACTAVLFALATLRSMFFVLETLTQLFGLLRYGVGFLLFFMGLKLCLVSRIQISHQMVCAVVLCTFALCISLSVIAQVIDASRATRMKSMNQQSMSV